MGVAPNLIRAPWRGSRGATPPRRLAFGAMTRLSQLLSAHRARAARRRRGALAQAHGPRRARAPGRRRAVDVAARRLARAPEGRADRARGDRRDRRPGDAHAGPQRRPSSGGARGATRSTRCSSSRTARGAPMVLAMTHEEAVTRPRRAGRALLPRPAAAALPLPDQGARRAAPARRRPAHARVHHEGRLHLRPRPRRPRRLLRRASSTRLRPRSSTAAAWSGTASSPTSG